MYGAIKGEFPVNLTLSPQTVALYHGTFVLQPGLEHPLSHRIRFRHMVTGSSGLM
jgi:hypothetical protein